MSKNTERCLWLSFCDPNKPDDQQFLGVAIVWACDIIEAAKRARLLGINPGGEVLAIEIDPNDIAPEHFNKFLTKDMLISVGYIDE